MDKSRPTSRYLRILRRLRHETGKFRPLPRLRLFSALARLLPSNAFSTLRTHLYRAAGLQIARGVAILGPMKLIGDGDIRTRLFIEEGTVIAPDVVLVLDAEIHIGKNVSLGPGASLYTATHTIGFGSRRMTFKVIGKPITIEAGSWVGMQSIVLAGVTVGQGCVISAGSVVTQSVPPNTLVMGNPAAVVQNLPFGNR